LSLLTTALRACSLYRGKAAAPVNHARLVVTRSGPPEHQNGPEGDHRAPRSCSLWVPATTDENAPSDPRRPLLRRFLRHPRIAPPPSRRGLLC
jgi:hypothetical protein